MTKKSLPNPLGSQLDGCALGHLVHGGLGHLVGQGARIGAHTGYAGHVDDSLEGGWLQMLDGQLGQRHGRSDVNIHGLVKCFGSHISQVLSPHDSSIVDKYV